MAREWRENERSWPIIGSHQGARKIALSIDLLTRLAIFSLDEKIHWLGGFGIHSVDRRGLWTA